MLEGKIPKICHLYWDGSPFSLLNLLSVESFRKHHPDWEIRMYIPSHRHDHKSWNSSEQKKSYVGDDYFDKLKDFEVKQITIDFEQIGFKNNVSEVIKSDYLRYWLLYNHGGLWSDCDIVYIRPITDVLHDFDTLIASNTQRGTSTYFPVGFLMCSKENALFKDALSLCNKLYNPNDYQCLGIHLLRHLFNKNVDFIKSKYEFLKIKIIDNQYYLPFPWDKLEQIYEMDCRNRITNCTFGIHWFNGAEKSKKYQSSLEEYIKQGNVEGNINVDATIFHYIQPYLVKYSTRAA